METGKLACCDDYALTHFQALLNHQKCKLEQMKVFTDVNVAEYLVFKIT